MPGVKGWSKYWCLEYRIGGTEKLLANGKYPDVTLDHARQMREEARKQLADGIDPGENKKAVKVSRVALTENSFESIAREWGQKHVINWEDRADYAAPKQMWQIKTQPLCAANPYGLTNRKTTYLVYPSGSITCI
jgi:Arm DNA-binding domain